MQTRLLVLVTLALGNSACLVDPDEAGSGQFCGGIAGVACPTGELCDFEAGDECGAGDASGVCHTRPTTCPEVYIPVIACDGRTYASLCHAHAAGTDAWHVAPFDWY